MHKTDFENEQEQQDENMKALSDAKELIRKNKKPVFRKKVGKNTIIETTREYNLDLYKS